MLVSHHKKQLIKFVIVFCSLSVTHAIVSQDAPKEALMTLKDGSRVSEALVKLVGKKLEKINDSKLLSTLAMASTQPGWRIKSKYKDHLQSIGLFDKDKKFVNTTTKNIIALSILLKPEAHLVSPLKEEPITKKSSDEIVFVTLKRGEKVPQQLVDQITDKLKVFEGNKKALHHLGGYASSDYWELTRSYFDLFNAHGLIDKKGRFLDAQVKRIIAYSILFKPEIRLVSPIKQEAAKIKSLVQELPKIEPQEIILEKVTFDADGFLSEHPGIFDFLADE